jgi:hypothetical protein
MTVALRGWERSFDFVDNLTGISEQILIMDCARGFSTYSGQPATSQDTLTQAVSSELPPYSAIAPVRTRLPCFRITLSASMIVFASGISR